MAERNKRKVLRGVVVSDKMDKTIVVELDTTRRHPLYGRHVMFLLFHPRSVNGQFGNWLWS